MNTIATAEAIQLTDSYPTVPSIQVKALNFKEHKTQVISLDTLKRTYSENDPCGRPLRGIYHYQFIQQVAELCERHGMDYQIEEIFAAQNDNKTQPGVVLLPEAEERFGESAVEAHILRRVFTTIKINDQENEETNTTLALAYHQEGLQAAIGANVKICHNQCILGRDSFASTYGKDKQSNEDFFETINTWLLNFSEHRITDLRVISQMRDIQCGLQDTYRLIGLLNAIRVCKDSKNKQLNLEQYHINSYPLSQKQITQFTEDALIKHQEADRVTLWDLYNVSNQLYKAHRMEIPNLIPQNVAMVEVLRHQYNL